jgi:hypothetical protein
VITPLSLIRVGSGQQAVELGLDDAVAGAGYSLQSFAVENGN